MDLSALRIFLAVAEERSFSRAAAKVHRTQPAVSQAVKRLEEDLGEQLFDRSSKSGTLTDARPRAAELRAAAGAAGRGDRVGHARTARPEARARVDRRQRGRHSHAPAGHGALSPEGARHRGGRASRACPTDRGGSATGEPRLRGADLQACRGRAARGRGRQRRTRAAGSALAPLCEAQAGVHAGRGGEPVVAHNDPSPARERCCGSSKSSTSR